MKLRVLFLKKKHLIYLSITLLIVIALIFIISRFNKSLETFNIITESKLIKADFTGDGDEDILYIKTQDGKYYIQINSKNDSFYLQPNKKINTVGYYYPHWPMRISTMDISRDNKPEIFIQASHNNVPVQHVFVWDINQFKDIFCSNNNIMGVLDSRNNKTPKFISGNLKDGTMNLSYNILIGKQFKNYSYDSSTLPGRDVIIKFIQYIETLPGGETNKPEIFYDGLSGKDLTLIGKLAGENNSYVFQDGYFTDSKANKNGEVSEIKWILNFKANSKNKEDIPGCYQIKLNLKPCPSFNNEFRIYSLNLSNN